MQKNRENLIWIDALRVTASFGVVLIHIAADVITEFRAVPMGDWWFTHVYDSLVRGCVSVFVMVSGALLLAPTDESLGDFFKKRANRILIPFLVWTILYLIWKKIFFLPEMGLWDAVQRAAGNQVHFHLWFFYALTGIYLVTPVFRFFARYAKLSELIYFIGLWFVMTSLLPFVEGALDLIWHIHFHVALPVGAAQGLMGYFVLGHLLRQSFTGGKAAVTAWVFWAASFTVCLLGTYFLAVHLGHYDGLFYENTAPNVVFFVAAFFVIVKNSNGFFQRLPAVFQASLLQFSKASFGIYLIHPMIMDAVEKGRWGFVLGPRMPPSGVTILATTALVYLISFLIVRLIQQIPYLKRIV